MGLIAEMIIRTYHESQHKTTYSVREVLAGGEPEAAVEPKPLLELECG
jgi:hypothetical protein